MTMYLGCCVDWNNKTRREREALSDMVDNAIDITYATLIKHVPVSLLAEIFPFYEWRHGKGLTLKQDWAVSYHRSKYLGKRVYYIRHSAIEYIFKEGERG